MRSRNLIILALTVVVLGAFIFFSERHMPTTEERRQQADRVFPGLERDDVASVEVRNSDGTFRLVRQGENWRIVEPIDAAADATTVSSLLGSLERLDAERTLAAGEVEPGAYGLDEPGLSVTLTTEQGDTLSLAIGEEAALGTNRAMRRGDNGDILLAAGWIVTDLDKPLEEWRSRDVVDVRANEVAALQVTAGEDRIHVVRDGDAWRLLEPLEDLADAEHVRNLISDLDALRVAEFLDEPPPLAELGLEAPSTRVTIVRSEEANPTRLDFGATRTVDGRTEIAARRDGADVFWVDDRAATRLAKAPVRWRATKVADFETWDAERLTISAGGESVTLERRDGMWSAAGGGEVDYGAVQDRLAVLSGLEAVEFDLVAPASEPAGTVELVLSDSDDDEQHPPLSLTFYRPLTEGGQALVRSSARPTVMSVEASVVETILSDPASLVRPPQEAESDDGGEAEE